MADISNVISQFREAVYGEEVRSAMVDLANAVNNEVENDTANVANYTSEINTKITQLNATEIALGDLLTDANRLNTQAIASSTIAAKAEVNSLDYSNKSQSYAVGGTNTRDGEDKDNAKYYCNSAQSSENTCSEILDEARSLLDYSRAEVSGYTFWIEEAGANAGYLFVDTSATATTFGIDVDGYLYVEV